MAGKQIGLKEFEAFLSKIDLNAYREKYNPIKIVEMDLPKSIQAIDMLYFVYWDEKLLIEYDEFYAYYLELYKVSLEEFREKTTMCTDCFYRGLPARIYRTWASIITQIQAGYVAELVFGLGTVTMSGELDRQGADFRVEYKDFKINYQIKKQSYSREVRQEKKARTQLDGEFINLQYEVPSPDCFANPRKRDGEFKVAYKRFIDNSSLERLPNGFVIFTPYIFEQKKQQIDNELK